MLSRSSDLFARLRAFHSDPRPLLVLGLALHFAGWLKFALEGDVIYVADWLLRAVVLALCVTAADAWRLLQWPRRPFVTVLAALGVLGALLVAEFFVWDPFWFQFVPAPWLHVSYFPAYGAWWLRAVDLTLGLVLVALAEEFVFRRLFVRVWAENGWRTWSLYAASAFAFAALHAPQGVARVAIGLLAGFLLMALYRRTGSLAACVAVHYVANVLVFSGAGCPWIGICSPVAL